MRVGRGGGPSLALACLLAATLTASAADGTPKRVRSAPVESREPVRELRFAGTTRAADRAVLSFTVGGRLEQRRGRLGQQVEAGDLLASIDSVPLENAVLEADAASSRARIQWRQARRELARAEKLVASGGRSERNLEEIRTAEESARALARVAQSRLEESERRLDEATLRAPFAGTISEIHVEPGEFVAPGAPVLALSGNSEFEVAFEVPEGMIRELRLGARVAVDFPLTRLPRMPAEVRSVTYVGLGPGTLFPVVADLGQRPGLMSGLSAEVVLEVIQPPALLVPMDAIIDSTGLRPTVFRVREQHAERIEVDVVELRGDRVIVQGELSPGDEVVVSGQSVLLDGDPVEPVPASPARP